MNRSCTEPKCSSQRRRRMRDNQCEEKEAPTIPIQNPSESKSIPTEIDNKQMQKRHKQQSRIREIQALFYFSSPTQTILMHRTQSPRPNDGLHFSPPLCALWSVVPPSGPRATNQHAMRDTREGNVAATVSAAAVCLSSSDRPIKSRKGPCRVGWQ